MAHFAKLDDQNTVLSVVVVDNETAPNEAAGVAFLMQLLDYDRWIQCSYNGTIRKQFPSAGYTYDPSADVFIAPRPFPSWALDANHDWQAPIQKPNDGKFYAWDEANLAWMEMTE